MIYWIKASCPAIRRRMNKFSISILASVFLIGCTTVKTIDVPIPVKCVIPAIEVPALPIDALQGSEDIFLVTKSLWSSIEIQQAVIIEMQSAMKTCQ
jgi:hypothetical protein